MIITKVPVEVHPSGLHAEWTQEEWEAGLTNGMWTGPISGTLVLRDGSAYDVTPEAIATKPEHALELEYAIHKAHHSAGRFLDAPLPADPFAKDDEVSE